MSSNFFPLVVDMKVMLSKEEKNKIKAERCVYLKVCYLAEELKCFGYKVDCPLYQKSNGEDFSEERFNQAMDRLIDKTMAKYHKLPK